MTPNEALAKLISIRHYCFARGILGRATESQIYNATVTNQQFQTFLSGTEPNNELYPARRPDVDFQMAFRDVNRLYAALSGSQQRATARNCAGKTGQLAIAHAA